MTEEFAILFGLNWQSYAIIFQIVFWTTLLVVFFVFIYNRLLANKQSKENPKRIKQSTNTSGKSILKQITISGIATKLENIDPKKYSDIVTMIAEIIPQFQEHLKVRPYTHSEANDFFIVYSQIFYWAMNFIPKNDEIELRTFILKHRKDLSQISEGLRILTRDWLKDMSNCLMEIYRFLSSKKLYEDFPHIDIRVIKYLLSRNPNLIINKENDSVFYHMHDENYNEFGVELREEFFIE